MSHFSHSVLHLYWYDIFANVGQFSRFDVTILAFTTSLILISHFWKCWTIVRIQCHISSIQYFTYTHKPFVQMLDNFQDSMSHFSHSVLHLYWKAICANVGQFSGLNVTFLAFSSSLILISHFCRCWTIFRIERYISRIQYFTDTHKPLVQMFDNFQDSMLHFSHSVLHWYS